MALLIDGGPAGLGGKGLDQLLKGSELPDAKEIARQAAVAAERAASTKADPATAERPAAYGVPSQGNTQESNTHHDTPLKLPPRPETGSYNAGGGTDSSPPTPSVDVEA